MAKIHTSNSDVKEKPIMSAKEARKVLGKVSKTLDDRAILDTVNALDKIAKLLANNTIFDKIEKE